MADTNNGRIDEAIKVEVSQDKMLGVISFTEAENGGKRLSPEEIRNAIQKNGIVKGLVDESIEELVHAHEYGYKYIVAKGMHPVDGQDGRIEFHFDTQALKELKPKLNEDGTVDLRDLSAVRNVKKGEVLAVRIAAVPGEDGYNVLGQAVRAKQGKEARIPKGKNTVVLEDGMTLAAEIDGKLEYDDHNVYINAVYNVMGDLDNSIGNINFVGDVVIYGSIHSGFEVRAGGSVEVKGPVDDAVIIAGKDIILTYGIQGNERSRLKSGGNIIAKFIQNAHVEAEGTITTEAIMHAQVTAGDSVYAENGKGTIVGGSVAATNLISAKSIGSPMGTVTMLQIGVLPTVYAEYKQLGIELREKRESLNKVDQSIKFLLAKTQGGGLDYQKKMMLEKFNATRKPLYDEHEELRQRYNALGQRLNTVKEGMVKFSDVIYPGVKITLGNLIKYVDQQYHHSLIRKENGEIIIE